MTIGNFKPIDTSPGSIYYERLPVEIYSVFDLCLFNGEVLEQRFMEVELQEGRVFYVYHPHFIDFTQKLDDSRFYGEGGQLLDRENISPYWEQFASGFFEGYDTLNSDIKHYTDIFAISSVEVVANRVFEEVKEPSKGSPCSYIYVNKKRTLTFNNMFQRGLETGTHYRAWSYIINNHTYFTNLIRSYFGGQFPAMEKYWRESNSHDPDYVSPLQTVIDELDYEKASASNKHENSQNIYSNNIAKKREPIVDVSDIVNLKKAFDGVIWDDNIPPSTFIDYWTIGARSSGDVLPLLERRKVWFVRLLIEVGLLEGKDKSGCTAEQIGKLFGIRDIYKAKIDANKSRKARIEIRKRLPEKFKENSNPY